MKDDYSDAWEDPRYFCGANEYLKSQMPDKPKQAATIIWVYTENRYNDRIFWDTLFREYYPEYKFKITRHKYSGSKALIKLANDNYLHACRIICIDSDHEYLLDNNFLKKNYVFHTYTHSVENHFCYGENLQHYCNTVSTLNFDDDYNFDFNAFLSEYSKIIYDNFVCAVCSCYKMDMCSGLRDEEKQKYFWFSNIVNKLSTEYFLNIEKIKKKYNANENELWNKIKTYSSDFVTELKDKIISEFKKDFSAIRYCESCKQSNKSFIEYTMRNKGVNNNNSYLFIHGHTLYDRGMKQLIKLLVEILKRISLSRLYNQNSEKKGFYNYFNSFKPHENIFPQGISFECELADKIKKDIKNFINNPKNQEVWF